jgi:protein SCO1/2
MNHRFSGDGFFVKNIMNKKAVLALFIATFVPVASYLILKKTGEDAVVMPRRFLMDSVVTKTVDGKTITDTVWHKTENIRLVNQLGDSVSLYDIQNRVIVADFFFTRCPYVCPKMTKNMARLQQSFSHNNKDGKKVIDSSIVRFVSFSIDPTRDSVAALRRYADKYGVDHDNWWMLTGDKKTIYDFALNELKLGVVDEGVDTSFLHTEKFVLLDKDYVVRGYYNGLDTTSLSTLAKDIGLLMLEKDKKKKFNIFEPSPL